MTDRDTSSPLKKGSERAKGTVLLTVISVIVITVVFSGALMSIVVSSTRASTEGGQVARCDYIANAALQDAFWEVLSQTDPTGNGIGAMGIVVPVAFRNSAGDFVGEYRTIIKDVGGTHVILAEAAVPTFASPEATRTLETVIAATPTFLLAPRPGAISMAGPLHPDNTSATLFPHAAGNASIVIDGGAYPAINLSNRGAYETMMDAFGELITGENEFDGTELTGTAGTPYDYVDPFGIVTELELAVGYQEDDFLTSTVLNDYRNALRASVLGLADNAVVNGEVQAGFNVIDSSVTASSAQWGTEESPQVTVIEAGQVGADSVFTTSGQTITGHGTLIIKDTLRPRHNLNLNWTGDVFVVGMDGTGDDLLYLFGSNVQIDGNMILLSDDNTEASLELANSSGTGSRPSSMTVNGAVLALAEAQSHEAEFEVEGDSSLTVNGLMGLFGSRIEIEASGSGSSFDVNGTLSVGMAQDVDNSVVRRDDFELEMRGSVDFTYDEALVAAAVEGLSDLETQYDLSSVGTQKWEVCLGGTVGDADASGTIQELIDAHGADYDYGLDLSGT